MNGLEKDKKREMEEEAAERTNGRSLAGWFPLPFPWL